MSASAAKRIQQSSARISKGSAKTKRHFRRTTVTLSPKAAEIVECMMGATDLSLSEAVSELIERAEPRPPRIKFVDGFPTADVPVTGKRISTAEILRAEAEPW